MLIDDMKNSADSLYSGWPDRLFLVDTQGKIAFRGDRGPRGFIPSELESAIKKAVGDPDAKPIPKLSSDELEAVRKRLREARKKSLGGK